MVEPQIQEEQCGFRVTLHSQYVRVAGGEDVTGVCGGHCAVSSALHMVLMEELWLTKRKYSNTAGLNVYNKCGSILDFLY